jgi:hypothetical protein
MSARRVMTRIKNAGLALCGSAALLTTMSGLVGASPARADGNAGWHVTFAANATLPSTGVHAGFSGSCEYAGGVQSGTDGSCEFEGRVHLPDGSGFTCHLKFVITSWTTETGTFVETGTATGSPAAVAEDCLATFPGGSDFTNKDTGFPAAPGHYDFGVGHFPLPSAVGEFNVTVVQRP